MKNITHEKKKREAVSILLGNGPVPLTQQQDDKARIKGELQREKVASVIMGLYNDYPDQYQDEKKIQEKRATQANTLQHQIALCCKAGQVRRKRSAGVAKRHAMNRLKKREEEQARVASLRDRVLMES